MKFRKMHGLGNDFVVLDARHQILDLSAKRVQLIGHRHFGIGFDQLVVIENDPEVDVVLTFWNADGTTAGACGNATRCCADILMDEKNIDQIDLRTERGVLRAERTGHQIRVNMGQPILDWQKIPLSHDVDVDALPIEGAPLATGMGNPHCTFFVENAEEIDLRLEGQKIENHELFPERTNVQFASRLGENHLRMRVWERGVGHTLASGSSSCAVGVAAFRRGLTGKSVRLTLDGGDIFIDWRDDGVWMTGPVAYVCDGEFDPRFGEDL